MNGDGIFVAEPADPIVFAAEELERYLARMGGTAVRRCSRLADARFVLGTFAALKSLSTGEPNDRWQDVIVLRSKGDRLFLGGSNPRSVLFAVYSYLEELGRCFLYPGPDGETVPCVEVRTTGFDLCQRAAARFRRALPGSAG